MSNSYQINFTDLVNKGFIQVDPNTVNTETSLKLPGRTKSDYGELVLENLLHLLENFANNNPPGSPIEGQLWYDTTIGVDQLKVYDGTQFVSASSIKKSNSRPEATESNLGDIWVDTVNQQLYLYNGNDWILVGPDVALDIIIDTTNEDRIVATTFVDNKRLLIVSDVEFIPKTKIPGFDVIKEGVNIKAGLKYYGTSESAENLIVPGDGNVSSSNFARRDKDNTFIKTIRIQNNGGISIGETPTIQIAVTGPTNAVFRNSAAGGNIQFKLTDTNSNSSIDVLTLSSDQKVGINKTNPTEALEVEGNIKVSSKVAIGEVSGIINSTSPALAVAGDARIFNNLIVDGNISAGNIELKDIFPDTANTRNIGSNNLRFNNIFAQTINAANFGNFNSIFNGTFIGELTGEATGLKSNTSFKLEGDINSNTISFGRSNNIGGAVRIFNTTLNTGFIADQLIENTVNQIDSNNQTIFDEILINRPGVGLRKINQNTLVSSIPAIPIGMISPFGGDIAPVGWLICDGSVRSTTTFNNLFTVIGYRFDPTLNGLNFRLPDLRGRAPLGNTQMGTNSSPADLVTVVDTGQLGAIGGSKETEIKIENLPEHQHSLLGDSGTQFYAVTSVSGATDTGVDATAPNVAGELASSSISQTGNIETNEDIGKALSVVNPYQAVNYIIYAGATN